MSLGTLVASLLGNMLPGKRIVRAGYENKEEKRIWRAGFVSKKCQFCLIFWLTLKYWSIIRMNPDSVEFIPEIISLKIKGIGHM